MKWNRNLVFRGLGNPPYFLAAPTNYFPKLYGPSFGQTGALSVFWPGLAHCSNFLSLSLWWFSPSILCRLTFYWSSEISQLHSHFLRNPFQSFTQMSSFPSPQSPEPTGRLWQCFSFSLYHLPGSVADNKDTKVKNHSIIVMSLLSLSTELQDTLRYSGTSWNLNLMVVMILFNFNNISLYRTVKDFKELNYCKFGGNVNFENFRWII